ncbi:acyl carrier protein, partial [Acinetobacter baumannii]
MLSPDFLSLFKQAASDVVGKPFDELDTTTAISDLGLDSIEAFEFGAYLEEKL